MEKVCHKMSSFALLHLSGAQNVGRQRRGTSVLQEYKYLILVKNIILVLFFLYVYANISNRNDILLHIVDSLLYLRTAAVPLKYNSNMLMYKTIGLYVCNRSLP